MDSQYKLLSELLSDQAAFITSPKTSLANYWGGIAPPAPPVSTGLLLRELLASIHALTEVSFEPMTSCIAIEFSNCSATRSIEHG